MGHCCFLSLGAASGEPEELDLSGGEVGVRPSKSGRLVLRVAPLDNERVRHIFLGFNEYWERDLWMGWLRQVSGACTVLRSSYNTLFEQKATTPFCPE
jgi:hypothetical protein